MQALNESLIEINGSYGEGGGQILRTSLTLSAIFKKRVTLHHIRAKRKNPSLRPQHVKGVETFAQIHSMSAVLFPVLSFMRISAEALSPKR